MYRDLENRLKSTTVNQDTIQAQASYHLNSLQKEITHRETEINQLNEKIKTREQHVDAAIVSNTINKVNLQKLGEQNENKDETISELRTELTKTQKMLDDALLQRKSEGTALLQSEHFR